MVVTVGPVYRPGTAIGVAVGGGFGVSTTFPPLYSATASPLASVDAVDIRLAVCAASVCVAGSADGLP